jgi:hypothetical protein
MSNVKIYVDENNNNTKCLIEKSRTGLTKTIILLEPISENSTIKVYLDDYDYTDKFNNLSEFNNQHGGAGNLIGSYAFSCKAELENIVIKLDVEAKFLSTEAKKYLGEWKNEIYNLTRTVENNFGVSYIRKYLLYSMYGFDEYEKTNYENIANIFIKNYDKMLKYYSYITSSKIYILMSM